MDDLRLLTEIELQKIYSAMIISGLGLDQKLIANHIQCQREMLDAADEELYALMNTCGCGY